MLADAIGMVLVDTLCAPPGPAYAALALV